ncbi:MAG TPA: cytochrome ubiquinol oxidase subunit I, partial [Nocardioidaceae bacterium]|nr:cytochrome ubiquinol oxidase subunit I [Nocardioidaceae bacterium]
DPWGWGRTLEWATSCPPPRHNFDRLPRIRSDSPAFDLHHPEIAMLELRAAEDMVGVGAPSGGGSAGPGPDETDGGASR